MTHAVGTEDRFEFYSPVRLHFEAGALDRLGEFAGPAGSVLLVTGRSSARAGGLVDRASRALEGRRIAVFDQVEPNPSIETVDRAADAAREMKADLVVGLGGGSAMDAAKAIAAIAPNSGRFRQEFGKKAFEHPPLRLIAVPTTCGTGSEANPYAIITDVQAQDKLNLSNSQTYPAVGLLDPTVLESLPRETLIDTGLDAFTHALEGYTSRRAQPAADCLALEAMGLIVRHLSPAADGDLAARANLLYASCLAGIVIGHTGTTVLHAMGYYLTLRHGVPHGRANAALLPALLCHIRRHVPQKVRAVLTLLPPGRRNLRGATAWLNDLGVRTTLSAYGVSDAEFAGFAGYVLSKQNTACTAGAIDKRLLLRLLRRYA